MIAGFFLMLLLVAILVAMHRADRHALVVMARAHRIRAHRIYRIQRQSADLMAEQVTGLRALIDSNNALLRHRARALGRGRVILTGERGGTYQYDGISRADRYRRLAHMPTRRQPRPIGAAQRAIAKVIDDVIGPGGHTWTPSTEPTQWERDLLALKFQAVDVSADRMEFMADDWGTAEKINSRVSVAREYLTSSLSEQLDTWYWLRRFGFTKLRGRAIAGRRRAIIQALRNLFTHEPHD